MRRWLIRRLRYHLNVEAGFNDVYSDLSGSKNMVERTLIDHCGSSL
jgi:hypothetical protein